MRTRRWCLWLALFAAGACSGDDDDVDATVGNDDDDAAAESCAPEPCGGSPIGEWVAESGCLAGVEELILGLCPEATFERNVDVGGSLSFDGTGGYVVAATLDLQVTLQLPADCVPGGDDCSNLDTQLGAACTSASGGCECAFVTRRDLDATGQWQVNGEQLELSGQGAPIDAMGLCVEGDTLRLGVATPEGLTVVFTLRRQ